MNKLFILPIVFVLAVLGVTAVGDLTIINESQSLSGNVSQTLTGNFTLNNTGASNLTQISFTSTQLTGSNNNISSGQVTLPATVSLLNSTELRTLFFSVGLTGNPYAETYAGTINATSNMTGNYDSFDFNVVVNPLQSVSFNNLNVGSVVEGGSGQGSLQVSNSGNTDLSNVNITVSNLVKGTNVIGNGNITFSNSSIDLAYGGSQTITVTVAVPTEQSAGSYTGNLTVDYGDSTLTGTLTVNVVDATTTLSISPSLLEMTGRFNTTVSDTFTVNNTGTLTINNLVASVSGLTEFSTVLNDTSSFNLAPGEGKTIRINSSIPKTFTPALYSGVVSVSNGTTTATMNVQLDVNSYISIDDLDITIDNDDDNNVGNGDSISVDAKPESHIEFDIKIENDYSSSVDDDVSDIENIFVRITIEDIDDGDEIEEESDDFDLDANDNHRETLEFDLPIEVDEGKYNVVVYVEGEGKDGVEHTAQFEIELTVDKRPHEITVKELEFRPLIVTPCSPTTELYAEFMNIGTLDEDEVYYRIENAGLKINFKEAVPYELDSNMEDDENTFEKTFIFTIDDDTEYGTYTFDVRTYYDEDRISNLKIVDLMVASCVEEEEEEQEEEQEEQEEQQQNGQETVETGPVVTRPKTEIVDTSEGSFFDSPTYIALLIAFNIVVLGGVSGLLIKVLRRY